MTTIVEELQSLCATLHKDLTSIAGRKAINKILGSADPPGEMLEPNDAVEVDYDIQQRLVRICVCSIHAGNELVIWIKLPKVLARRQTFLNELQKLVVGRHYEEWE